ncbi:MAG: hydroxymethylpyrimidine/phosphomethylpyrimidine kinase [Myxococcales bacterium]|nr:hydroxymethylpyrimidine/phosphomethylpyrimidine kinase [Myxococcales bacterium]
MNRPPEAPNVLVIAGLDPSGGAGLIADVRVCELHGCRPVAVATALTEQTTLGLRAVNPVDPAMVREQLIALLSDVELAAVKIGMLGSVAMAEAVAEALALTAAPVVWDPVARASQGATALTDDELGGAAGVLGPGCALVTPNADEARAITGLGPISSIADAIGVASVLRDQRDVEAVLIKGGHWGGDDDEVIDVLVAPAGVVELRGPRVAGGSVHGTGCALATAIACGLARGATLATACADAKAFVAARIAAPARPGRGRAAVL